MPEPGGDDLGERGYDDDKDHHHERGRQPFWGSIYVIKRLIPKVFFTPFVFFLKVAPQVAIDPPCSRHLGGAMKLVETYQTREKASEARRHLVERGIDAKLMVDSVDGRYSALSQFDGVAIFVDAKNLNEARAILAPYPLRKAS